MMNGSIVPLSNRVGMVEASSPIGPRAASSPIGPRAGASPAPTIPTQRPNLFLLMLQHHFQLLDLARASRQHPFVLWNMILGHPVKSEQAVQVVGALNELCGTTYALVQMEVNVQE